MHGLLNKRIDEARVADINVITLHPCALFQFAGLVPKSACEMSKARKPTTKRWDILNVYSCGVTLISMLLCVCRKKTNALSARMITYTNVGLQINKKHLCNIGKYDHLLLGI